jgi:DNA polymerase-3 subunit gamma/tau
LTQALYNRIRPRTFAQVVGQEHVTDALSAALRSGRLHHAFLFSGPRGCGKTSSARILAASLNCITGPTPTPCGTCEHCVAIRAGSSMDVIEIDAASHRGIDDAREIRERAIFMPASARFKVYIIDEAHQITSDAFNALLKLVEEPPPHLKFVFATTEPEKVLQTIRSRTHHYAFRLVPPAMLREFLAKVCVDEGAEVDAAVLPLVVRAGAGSVRDSLSVLDQLLAGAGPDGLTAAHAAALLGLSDASVLDDAVEALAAKAPSGAFSVVDHVMATGHDPRRFAMDLLERVRDLLVLQTVPDAPDRGLLAEYAADQIERMRNQAGRMGAAELSRAAELLHNGLVEMRDTISPRLMLELVLSRALLPGASVDPSALQVRLERLERQLARGGAAPASEPAPSPQHQPQPPRQQGPAAATPEPARPPAPTPAPKPPAQAWPDVSSPGQVAQDAPPPPKAQPQPQTPPTPAAPAAPAATSSDLSLASVVPAWPDLLSAIAASRAPGFRTAGALLAQGQPTAVRGTELVLAFTPGNATNFQKSGTAETLLREALSDRFGGSWKVTVVHKSPTGGTVQLPPADGAPAAAPPTPDDIESSSEVDLEGDGERARLQDPVAFAMEALGAQIVDERETS